METKTAESVLKNARENNEPVFVLRAKDICSVDALWGYYHRCNDHKCSNEHLDGIEEIIIQFDQWREEHSEQVRIPD